MMNDERDILEIMREADAIGDIDVSFARLMARTDASGGDALAVAAALVSAVATRGETSTTFVDLEARAGEWLDQASIRSLHATLTASPVCGDGSAPTPIVVDGERLYLYRYFDYERRLAAALLARNGPAGENVGASRLRERLDSLFPGNDAGTDWQKVAAALAALRRLVIISGGPGTGKTTTVVRLLAMMLEQAQGGCRIALAAPTGKAAARMAQAVAAARTELPVDDLIREAIPDTASTIHRLLGARARGGGFRHHADNPVPVDVLVVDEVSMVDLALMTRLLEAVPDHARVVLIGDRDQLAAVEPGSVFADLCLGADGFTDEIAADLTAVTGDAIEARSAAILPDACVLLKRSYRFAGDSGIGRLAEAIKQGDAAAAVTIVSSGVEDLHWDAHEAGERGTLLDALVASEFAPRLQMMRDGAAPAELFARYARSQILCAVRRGASGVDAMNAAVERRLVIAGAIDVDDPYYLGRPIMVTANDYSMGLFNGDIGIILPYPTSGSTRACFMADGDEPMWFHPARLPPHETAWALTVHKSQGSEFDEVTVVLPEGGSPVLSRELLYTAVTRARRLVTLWAERAVLDACVARRTDRHSGLALRLASSAAERR